MTYWIYTSPVHQQLRVKRQKNVIFELFAVPGSQIRLTHGDVLFKMQASRWVQFFRIRKARGQMAIHYGKHFGDRWWWLHVNAERHHLKEAER